MRLRIFEALPIMDSMNFLRVSLVSGDQTIQGYRPE